MWINNNIINKFVTEEIFQKEYPTWNRGRLLKKDSSGKIIT